MWPKNRSALAAGNRPVKTSIGGLVRKGRLQAGELLQALFGQREQLLLQGLPYRGRRWALTLKPGFPCAPSQTKNGKIPPFL